MSKDKNGFCGGLKLGEITILLETYRLERISNNDLQDYLDFLKNDDINVYTKFLEYKKIVEKRTPNLKEIYYDFLDGKIDDLDFELFSPY